MKEQSGDTHTVIDSNEGTLGPYFDDEHCMCGLPFPDKENEVFTCSGCSTLFIRSEFSDYYVEVDC